MRQGQGSYAAVAGGVGVEQGQVERSPDLDNAAVASRQQILSVSRHQNALKWQNAT